MTKTLKNWFSGLKTIRGSENGQKLKKIKYYCLVHLLTTTDVSILSI